MVRSIAEADAVIVPFHRSGYLGFEVEGDIVVALLDSREWEGEKSSLVVGSLVWRPEVLARGLTLVLGSKCGEISSSIRSCRYSSSLMLSSSFYSSSLSAPSSSSLKLTTVECLSSASDPASSSSGSFVFLTDADTS